MALTDALPIPDNALTYSEERNRRESWVDELPLPDGREFEEVLAEVEPHALAVLVFHMEGCEFCEAVQAEIERRYGVVLKGEMGGADAGMAGGREETGRRPVGFRRP